MTVAVQLRPLAKRTIARRIRQRRAAFSVRLAGLLREYFKQQRARVLTRLSYDAHLHEGTRFSVKALPPAVQSLLPPSEDTALSLAIRPYLEQGILSSADLASLLVGGVLPESSQSAGVQRLLDNAGQRIVQINDATRRAVQEQLQTANAAGYSLYQIANGVPADGFRGIADTVEQLYRGRAEAIARTEVGSASLAASQAQWRELGVRYQEIIDGEDDEECAARNGTVVSIEEEVELLHPNCFPPGVAVTADGVVAATLRPYDGKLITIRTSLDSSLRCTPNHPILTGRGWVGAGELVEGDDVFGYRPKFTGVAPPTYEYMEASVEQIAGSLLMASFHTGGYIGSFPNAPDQFHGDGGSKGDVDIVRAVGPLLRESNSPFDLELDNQSIFSFTAVELETLAGLCSQQLSLERVDLPTAGRVSSVGGALAGGPASYTESRTEVGVIPTDIRADMRERLAAFIAIVQHGYVVAVEESSYSGHVYNLQTRTGYMIADGLLTSNCTVVTLPTMSDEGAALAAGVGGASGEDEIVHGQEKGLFDWGEQLRDVERAGGEDPFLKEMNRLQGYDGLPSLVSNEELSGYVARGEREIWRGISDDSFIDAFKFGNFRAGGGIFGNGTYTAYGEDGYNIAKGYTYGGSKEPLRMTLKEGSRVVDYNDLLKVMEKEEALLQERYASEIGDLMKANGGNENLAHQEMASRYGKGDPAFQIVIDPGRYATSLGYDAIDVTSKRFMVVLNRTALRIVR